MISILLAKKILQLFLMIFAGLGLVKFKVIRAEDSDIVSRIVLYLILPCCIVSTFQIELTKDVAKGLIFTAVLAAAMMLLEIGISELAGKLFHLSVTEKCSIAYPNSGNLIIPLVMYIFGREWVVYVTMFFAVQMIFTWTHMDTKFSHQKAEPKKIITNINIIAVIVGLLLLVLRIPLPEALDTTLSTLGDMIGPLSMLLIGISMANVKPKRMIRDGKAYLTVIMRLVVVPLIALLLMWLLRLHTLVPNGATVTTIVLMAVAPPSAAIVVQLALLHHEDAEHASVINVMTTLPCIATMPLLIGLYQRLIG